MLLADKDILDEVEAGSIIIDPFDPAYLQPASYDVHLDDTLLVPKHQNRHPEPFPDFVPFGGYAQLDPSIDSQPLERENISRLPVWLPPGGVALGCTRELVTLSPTEALAADIAGCSSLGRWFLFVHVTAGFIDPGWSGRLTLELYNASPWWLRLRSGMRIAQIRFWYTHSVPMRSYLDTGHYAGALTALPSAYKG